MRWLTSLISLEHGKDLASPPPSPTVSPHRAGSSHCFLQLSQSWLSSIIKYLFIYQFYRRIQPFEHVFSEIQHWLDASSYPGRDFIPPTRNGNNPQRVHLLYKLSPPKVLAITVDKGRNSSIQLRWNKRQTILRETISALEGKKQSEGEGVKPAGGLTLNSGFFFLFFSRNILYYNFCFCCHSVSHASCCQKFATMTTQTFYHIAM